MGFGEVVREMVEGVGGGVAGTIMGRDGIAVCSYVKGDIPWDVEAVGVEYGRVMEEIKRVASNLRLGEVEEISIFGHGSTILVRFINEDYFAALIINTQRYLGKARFILKRAVTRARKEF